MGFLVGNDFIPHLPHMHINMVSEWVGWCVCVCVSGLGVSGCVCEWVGCECVCVDGLDVSGWVGSVCVCVCEWVGCECVCVCVCGWVGCECVW